VSARFLDDAARAAFAKAVSTIEDASALEVVIAVRRKSAGYRLVNAVIGAVVAFVALATVLYVDHEFSTASILIDPFVSGLLAAALIELAPAIKRLVASPDVQETEVRRGARATFVERGVHNTRDRSGVLVYISWLEQRVCVVPDSGLAQALPAAAVERLELQLTAAMRSGGAAVARALEQALIKITPAMPRRADDVNELPDAIDSDLEKS
jgi:putative membrane protein